MFFSKLNAMSVGTMWVSRSQEESQFATHSRDFAEVNECFVCGGPWVQSNRETDTVIVVLPEPVTNEAQQTLLENCLKASGWHEQCTHFALHLSCASNGETALHRLKMQITTHAPEWIIVFGHAAAELFQPEFIHEQTPQFENTRIIVTHHPEEMLANPALKRQVWMDICTAKME